MHYPLVKPSFSNFSVITANILGVWIFWIFTVHYLHCVFIFLDASVHGKTILFKFKDKYSSFLSQMFLIFFYSYLTLNWAGAPQNKQNDVRPAKTQSSPVWSVFAVRLEKAWILGYPSTQRWLIRLAGCPGWSESSLGTRHCWFCHAVAQIYWFCSFWVCKYCNIYYLITDICYLDLVTIYKVDLTAIVFFVRYFNTLLCVS